MSGAKKHEPCMSTPLGTMVNGMGTFMNTLTTDSFSVMRCSRFRVPTNTNLSRDMLHDLTALPTLLTRFSVGFHPSTAA